MRPKIAMLEESNVLQGFFEHEQFAQRLVAPGFTKVTVLDEGRGRMDTRQDGS